MTSTKSDHAKALPTTHSAARFVRGRASSSANIGGRTARTRTCQRLSKPREPTFTRKRSGNIWMGAPCQSGRGVSAAQVAVANTATRTTLAAQRRTARGVLWTVEASSGEWRGTSPAVSAPHAMGACNGSGSRPLTDVSAASPKGLAVQPPRPAHLPDTESRPHHFNASVKLLGRLANRLTRSTLDLGRAIWHSMNALYVRCNSVQSGVQHGRTKQRARIARLPHCSGSPQSTNLAHQPTAGKHENGLSDACDLEVTRR